MIRVLIKKIKRWEITDITYAKVKQFYEQNKNKGIIMLIYEDSELKTLLSYEDFCFIKSEKQFLIFLQESDNRYIWNENNDKEAEKAFLIHPWHHYYIIRLDEDRGVFFSTTMIHGKSHAYEQVNNLYRFLKNKGVCAYRVNIPSLQDVENDQCHGIGIEYGLYKSYLSIAKGGMDVPWFMDKVTDKTIIKDLKFKDYGGGYKFGNTGEDKRTIYIVGPCLVVGWINPDGETLAQVMYEKLRSKKMNFMVCPVRQMTEGELDNETTNILSYDIRKNDIVIFIDQYMDECELDMTELYNCYKGDKWLYQDLYPIHTTITANRLIADAIIEKIIVPIERKNNKLEEHEIIYHAEPQFTNKLEKEIYRFVDKVKAIRYLSERKQIGAVVMNCNPFTYGHRYLIEYAANKMDFIYLFVVEEDQSEISFIDRLFMVYEGIKDISNVIVVPSGKFIISEITFSGYFKKEMGIHNVRSEEDVYIFARYIAKGLNITKRFVGQEPTDLVTDNYNQMMKLVFPKYGIELIEIPRKEASDRQVISAKKVRELLLFEKWDELENYVPITTLRYLRKNKNDFIWRIKTQKKYTAPDNDFVQEEINEFVNKICSYDKVVFYSIGEDTRCLLNLLPQEWVEHLEYCDKQAEEKTIFYRKKQVLRPEQLLSEYIDYNIIITSSQYAIEIFEELLDMGIDRRRCIINKISFQQNEQLNGFTFK